MRHKAQETGRRGLRKAGQEQHKKQKVKAEQRNSCREKMQPRDAFPGGRKQRRKEPARDGHDPQHQCGIREHVGLTAGVEKFPGVLEARESEVIDKRDKQVF